MDFFQRAPRDGTRVLACGFAAAVFLFIGASSRLPAGPVSNLADAFYDRPGLEGMPRIDYASMPAANVRDFGARGDGMHPENEAFHRAVASVQEQGGGVVYIPAGTYRFVAKPPHGFIWQKKQLTNIHFIGDGEASLIRFDRPGLENEADFRGSFNGWRLDGARNVSLRDLSFTWRPHFSMRTYLPGYTVVFIDQEKKPGLGENIQTVNVRIDQGQIGLTCWDDIQNVWVVDCTVTNTAADAIHFERGINVVAAYNRIENANDDSIANVIKDKSRQGQVTGNKDPRNVQFLYNTVLRNGWGRGITLGGRDQVVAHNWVECMVTAAIYPTLGRYRGGSTSPLVDTLIHDNTIVRGNLIDRPDNDRGGSRQGGAIKLSEELRNVEFRDNRVLGSGATSVNLGRHHGLNARDLTFRGNRIEGSGEYGIHVEEQAAVHGLNLIDNTIVATADSSLFIEGDLRNLNSRDNEVTTLPRVAGDRKKPQGFRQIEAERDYVDAYQAVRTEPSETGWDAGFSAGPPAGPVVNVRDHGASGDGNTSDTAAFLAAVAALPARGGVLFIPAGDYLIKPLPPRDSRPHTRIRHHLLIADRKNIRIAGARDKTRLTFSSPDHQGIRLLNVSRCWIENLNLELREQPPLRRNRALLELSGCRRVFVDSVTATRSSGPGIDVDASTRVTMQNNVVRHAGTHGIRLGASRQIDMTGNRIFDSRDHGIFVTWKGSVAREPQYVRIVDNRVAGTRESGGIAIGGGDHVTVRNNSVSDSYLAGIWVVKTSGHFPHNRIEVTGNHLRNVNRGKLSYTPGAICVHNLGMGDIVVAENRIGNTPYAGIWVGGRKSGVGRMQYSKLQRLEIRGNRYETIGGDRISIGKKQREKIASLVLE